MKTIYLIIVVLSLSACAPSQLPKSSLPVSENVNMDTLYGGYGSIINANGGLLASNLTKVLGAIGIPDSNGNCDVKSLSVTQCLVPNSKVEIVPDFNITPKMNF